MHPLCQSPVTCFDGSTGCPAVTFLKTDPGSAARPQGRKCDEHDSANPEVIVECGSKSEGATVFDEDEKKDKHTLVRNFLKEFPLFGTLPPILAAHSVFPLHHLNIRASDLGES